MGVDWIDDPNVETRNSAINARGSAEAAAPSRMWLGAKPKYKVPYLKVPPTH